MADIQPMEQFLVRKIAPLPVVHVPGLPPIDFSITNSVAFMLSAAGLICLFFLTAARRQIVPGRMQALAEQIYGVVDNTLTGGIIGDKGRHYLPFVFTLFLMIAMMNLLGLLPGGFTVTSQLAVTTILAIMTFLIVIIIGFALNGPGFVKLFWPDGMPLAIKIVLLPIELISFFVRPLTLAVRLFGNMLGGHVVLYMFAAFIVGLGTWALTSGGVANIGFVAGGLSFAMVVALYMLEFVVALLQAFVFAALTCVYLNEVVNFGHGH